jgi:hypothetical protein
MKGKEEIEDYVKQRVIEELEKAAYTNKGVDGWYKVSRYVDERIKELKQD